MTGMPKNRPRLSHPFATLPAQRASRFAWRLVAGLALLGVALDVDPARAQSPANDAVVCADAVQKPDQAIAACTRAIDSKQLPPPVLAASHYNRGNAWFRKADFDKAIADYDEAAKLDPQDSAIVANRARAWLSKGELDKAQADIDAAIKMSPRSAGRFLERGRIWLLKAQPGRSLADFDAALRLDPNLVSALAARGRAKFYLSRYADALADLTQSRDKRNDAYGSIWLYIVKGHMGQDGTADLAQASLAQQPSQWPAPIVAALEGKLDRKALLAIAAKAEAAKRGDQVCEAEFYLGEMAYVRGDKAEAESAFTRAKEICPKTFIEYEAAVNELAILKK
jgi:lipoprotein NlpI